MATLVGTQSEFSDALKELLELEYDALEIYQAGIDRLQNESFRGSLSTFKAEHERHVKELSQLLEKNGVEFTKGPSGKQVLLIGSVAISKVVGDDLTVLKAMIPAENDTNTAYERMLEHDGKFPGAEEILKRGLENERKHREWLVKTTSA